MVKTKSFKDNEEYFKFINDFSKMESVIIHDLKLVDGKYKINSYNASNSNIPKKDNDESTDEIEWPSIEKHVGNKQNHKKQNHKKQKQYKKEDIPKQVLYN